MKLSQVSCRYGAPMGRIGYGIGGLDAVVFELEWMPLTDGAYDSQGAYWGGPDNLYCAVGTLDDEEVAVHYLRAADRDEAWAKLQLEMGYENCTLLPENGSLIKQAITWLEEYLDGLDPEDRELAAGTEEEINGLESLLEEKGLA